MAPYVCYWAGNRECYITRYFSCCKHLFQFSLHLCIDFDNEDRTVHFVSIYKVMIEF